MNVDLSTLADSGADVQQQARPVGYGEFLVSLVPTSAVGAFAEGDVKTWNFEMASTLALERAGWTRKTLPVGTEVTIGGFGGRAVTERAIASSITTAEGKALFVGKPGQ